MTGQFSRSITNSLAPLPMATDANSFSSALFLKEPLPSTRIQMTPFWSCPT